MKETSAQPIFRFPYNDPIMKENGVFYTGPILVVCGQLHLSTVVSAWCKQSIHEF